MPYSKKIFLLVAALLIMALPAMADQLTLTGFNVSDSGQLGYKTLVEAATTNDTVTAAETGKAFLVTPAAGKVVTFTLPTAADGLTYSFYLMDGLSATSKTINLNPASTDTFVGCVNSSGATTFAAGDSLKAPGATGDTVTILGTSTKWVCTSRVGTWTDNNTSNL